MDNYIDYDSDASVFMSALLFPLTCVLSDISKIIDFRTSIYASTFLHLCHVQYCQIYEDYDLSVFYPTESWKAKIKFSFLSLSLLLEIQCIAVSLLYLKSENDNLNLSCIITAGNETFHGRSKSYLAGDETVIRCINSPFKFILGEIMGSSIVK